MTGLGSAREVWTSRFGWGGGALTFFTTTSGAGAISSSTGGSDSSSGVSPVGSSDASVDPWFCNAQSWGALSELELAPSPDDTRGGTTAHMVACNAVRRTSFTQYRDYSVST